MTIGAGMLCSDGIVLCADSLESVGTGHRYVEKLLELPLISDELSAVLVCATDNGVFADALIARISDALDRSDGTFASAAEAIENSTLRYCGETWPTFAVSNDKPNVEMLVGLKTVDDLRLLHMVAPVVRTIDTPEFIGFGADLGIYKAKQYALKDMPVDTAVPMIAYILDIVKNNVQFCGGPTNLAVLHKDGRIERKSEEYIARATQGYRSLEWVLDAWVFPFLPLMVSDAGEDVLSMIGKLGKPKAEWVEKIPRILNVLVDRKRSILAGEIPAIPADYSRKVAVRGFLSSSRTIMNSAKKLYEEDFVSGQSNDTIQARYQKVVDLTEVILSGMEDPNVDEETVKQSLDRLCLVLTSFESLDQLLFDLPKEQHES